MVMFKLISTFMTKCVHLPKLTSSNDVSNLHEIYGEVEFSLRNLNSLKVEKSSFGSLLVLLLNEKLPNDIHFNLARKFKDDVWKLDDMPTFLKTEIEAKERSISVRFSTDSFESKSYENNHQNYSASAWLTHASTKACPFCNLRNHNASKYLKVANPNIRKQIFERERTLRFLPLESGHVAKFCKKSYYCKRCNGKHNILVCTFKKAEEPPNDAAESIAINLNHAENGNLIQTAITMVSNLSNTKSDNSSVIFDAGRALFQHNCEKNKFANNSEKEFLYKSIW